MKNPIIYFVIMFMAALFAVNCSNNPVSFDESSFGADSLYEEASSIDSEINELEESCISDTADNPYKRLARALVRLERLLYITEKAVTRADIDSATALLRKARTAQQKAIAAADQDSLHLSFCYIRESKHCAIQALKCVRSTLDPPPSLQDISDMKNDAEKLISQITPLIEDCQNVESHIYFTKGKIHYRVGNGCLIQEEYRKSYFHYKTSVFWLNKSIQSIHN